MVGYDGSENDFGAAFASVPASIPNTGVRYPAMGPTGAVQDTAECYLCHTCGSEAVLPIGKNPAMDPPLRNHTREEHLLCLRRLLDDLAIQGHPLRPGLIIREDFPVRPEYLPRPLSPEDDERLQEELRRADTLYSNALLLTRITGIRIGECIHLPLDCQLHLGPEQWALHVPLGKLHNERLVPLDSEGLRLLARILELRSSFPGPPQEI